MPAPPPPPPVQPLNTLTGGETLNFPVTGGLPVTISIPPIWPPGV